RHESHPPRLLWYTRFTEATPSRVAQLVAPLFSELPELRLAVVGEEINRGDEAAARSAIVQAGIANRVDWLGYRTEGLDEHDEMLSGAVAIYPLDDDLVN